jgi:hypothetical protein
MRIYSNFTFQLQYVLSKDKKRKNIFTAVWFPENEYDPRTLYSSCSGHVFSGRKHVLNY